MIIMPWSMHRISSKKNAFNMPHFLVPRPHMPRLYPMVRLNFPRGLQQPWLSTLLDTNREHFNWFFTQLNCTLQTVSFSETCSNRQKQNSEKTKKMYKNSRGTFACDIWSLCPDSCCALSLTEFHCTPLSSLSNHRHTQQHTSITSSNMTRQARQEYENNNKITVIICSALFTRSINHSWQRGVKINILHLLPWDHCIHSLYVETLDKLSTYRRDCTSEQYDPVIVLIAVASTLFTATCLE